MSRQSILKTSKQPVLLQVKQDVDAAAMVQSLKDCGPYQAQDAQLSCY